MAKIAVIILTLNEAPRIEEALKQFKQHVDFILVVDGESTDKTVEIAKKYADKVVIKKPTGTYPEERNRARLHVPSEYTWILWVDADERFDPGFLRRIKTFVQEGEKSHIGCFRFPRSNLPDGKDWPDYQVRLFPNSRDIEWRGIEGRPEVCNPFLIKENIPLDQADREDRETILGVKNMDEYPILHLPRRENIKRSWWE